MTAAMTDRGKAIGMRSGVIAAAAEAFNLSEDQIRGLYAGLANKSGARKAMHIARRQDIIDFFDRVFPGELI